ncbi:DUF3427 domain-containing protein [Rhizosphaericola mali]|uniref:DUF3427 domain-containing protein n=1 Tax=Rhizosphaericola mali TaxID=2545455 RepID=A0A5P2G6C0_9BACT|nr:DUF3427 domain-containing protein [Rhizosphaericola mali]QES90248.1 DUF3427 domain-containing protein [Rhizosphaericola mali]
MDNLRKVFTDSIHTGFIDKEILSDLAYQPELLVNQKQPPKKVLTTIIKELEHCSEFLISVAFVTTGGVSTIINTLQKLAAQGIKGKVLVSQYLNFTQPEALKRLLQFQNIDLRITTIGNAHAKGYIFKNNRHYNLIVGSSNLTDTALSSNKEWNMKVSALDNSDLVHKVLKEFYADFEKATIVSPQYLQQYEEIYQKQLILNKKLSSEFTPENETHFKPNLMQTEALSNLQALRERGQKRALIISATGTGKTFLSAFDAKNFNPRKLLFVVHRLTIAKSAMKTFKHVFGKTKTMGLYSGNQQDFEADFIFATVQTISKQNHLNLFSKAHFDYIIIDETHRSAADTYLKILEYFTPNFLLGMTATPERSDGIDIFKLFDYNIAYEIRLSRAMEEEMLSTFHYFGLTDIQIGQTTIDRKSDFNLLVSKERVDHIIERSKFYGSDNGITRGLIFCSRKDEAIELSKLFNKKGLNTIALTGDSSDHERSQAIDLLESDNLSEKIDFIFTVDIFNEGVDIPKVNQVIMLRPTESAIIFIQQLGRGLRKIEGKGYLTVIDFIGNYENNYLIPIALFGDTSYNKDTLRKLINDGSLMIPGASTINFDEITKERIFQSIDAANMQLYADLKKDYNALKYRLGRVPMMMDFLENASRDPFLFVEYSRSYYNFVCKIENKNDPNLTDQEIKLLELFSKEINNSKRVDESIILELLIENKELSVEKFKNIIKKKYGYSVSDQTINSCLINLNFEFVRENKEIVCVIDNSFLFSNSFMQSLENDVFKRYLLDSTKCAIKIFDKIYSFNKYKDGIILYNKYSRKDICRLLNWDKDISSTIYGYRTNMEVTPCFVTYHKSKDIDDSINYNDHFINPSTFAWESRSNRRIDSNEIKAVINSKRILLFVKKENGEGSDFYFLGNVKINLESIRQQTMKETLKPVVHFQFLLESSVPDNLYNYITNSQEILSTENKLDQIEKNEIPRLDPIEKSPTIPLFNFYAAAGSFSELQSDNEFTSLDAPNNIHNTNDYFACRIRGESMNRVIPNGSICLFKKYTGGSRNGKIVLVENVDIQDPDFHSAFTIKTYASEKIVTEEGWTHTSIRLRPNSYDGTYSDIIIDEENGQNMKVVGEFVTILQ